MIFCFNTSKLNSGSWIAHLPIPQLVGRIEGCQIGLSYLARVMRSYYWIFYGITKENTRMFMLDCLIHMMKCFQRLQWLLAMATAVFMPPPPAHDHRPREWQFIYLRIVQFTISIIATLMFVAFIFGNHGRRLHSDTSDKVLPRIMMAACLSNCGSYGLPYPWL